MSKLKAAIEALLLKQQEVEFYRFVQVTLGSLGVDDKSYSEVREKIIKELDAFCTQKINIIEGIEAPKPERPKVYEKPTDKEADPAEEFDDAEMALRDPLKFVVKYRTWENKQAYVKDGYGNTVEVTVVGMNFPNLRVRLMSGVVIPASPKDIRLITKPEGEKDVS